ncbi:MAG TPA: FAD-dependent monooxygenase [Bryobacteraceae bacterium]|nr:FAD-dependent monooxygenase [Bryobacteraceae bacterium]
MRKILIAGCGPAGAAAAIAGLLEGAAVRMVDRAKSFRHKVCGEFISPGAVGVLEALRVWPEFANACPCRIRRCILHIGNREKRWNLSETAWGLSRLELDRLLVRKAVEMGAAVSPGEAFDLRGIESFKETLVVACGRRRPQKHGDRLFGFKTHFEGPCDDSVELFFGGSGYAGVSGIENGWTNVCGIAPESVLRRDGFDFDAVVRRSKPLAERLRPLRRRMPWVSTGPIGFSAPSADGLSMNVYAAGDALGFVDPFTGTGIMNALLTGRMAGISAARGIPVSEHLKECRALLRRPFLVSSVLRRLLVLTPLHWLAPCLPAQTLFRLTRARSTLQLADAVVCPEVSRP